MRQLAFAASLLLNAGSAFSQVSNPAAVAQSSSTTAATPDPRAERGRYLATAGDCVSCHTTPNGAPFSGGVGFQTALGKIYSTNITPDAATGIGNWTVNDLQRAMHEGIARDGSRLFPAFPYPSFTKVSDADVADIYFYLRTLKPVRTKLPDNDAAFSMRWPLALWNNLYFKEGRFAPENSKSSEWNRGAYLVEGLGHCGSCHTPRNALFAEQSDRAYQGGAIQSEVAAGKLRRWSAVNLTSARQGLAAWSVADLTRYFQTGVSSRAGTFGPMNEVIVNSLRQLTPADLHAMAVYVKSLEGPTYSGPPVSAELAAQGAAIYKDRCQKCHGSSGRGGYFSGPPLAGSAVVQAEDPASLINIILEGPQLPKGVSFGAWETMSSYGDILDDAQVAMISNFMRGSWGNRAGAVSAADVRAQR